MQRIVALASLLFALACFGGPAAAQSASAQAIRAAMVFNFLKFTEFPPESLTDAHRLRLCFSVDDPLQAEALNALGNRRVWNRDLIVVPLGQRNEACQVIYVDSRQRWNAAAEARGIGAALTIGGYRGFVEDGGVIEIDLQNDGNRFDINLAQARLTHLRMAPQVLRLARRIHE